MFNSTILDVALGMIFVYLLLSLMCSAASEIIELMLKKRAIDLERGIRELLVPGSKSGTKDIVQKLYDHALINGLFGGKYGESRIESRLRVIMRTQLPSYIPARSFALALMDLVGTPTPAATTTGSPPDTPPAQTTSGAACATGPLTPVNPSQVVINLLNAKGEEASSISVPVTPASPETSPLPTAGDALASLRKAVLENQLLPETSRRALITLLDASGNDVVKARENIENWYDASMDRVSSWYKRRVQIIIFILGLAIAIAVNADSVTIVKRLASDKALRDSLVAASQEYAKTQSSPPVNSSEPQLPVSAVGSTASPTPTPVSIPTPTPAQAPTPQLALPQACYDNEDSEECKFEKDLQKIRACAEDRDSRQCLYEASLRQIPACVTDRNSPECRYERNLQQINGLGLPLGWDSPDDAKRRWAGWSWKGDRGGWWDQARWHWLGWFLTALAISLGAPFWFDLLNKFIVIRSAVKPHEKSPEEGSKD